MLTTSFLVTSLILILIPGTGVIFTVSTGLAQGRRAGAYAALGCTAGIVPHLLATVFGLAAVLHTSALAFQTLRYAGALYLLYLAACTWKDRTALSLEPASVASPPLTLVTKAILLNLLNPKLTIFFLAFLPQFVNQAGSEPLTQLLLLSGVFMGMTFAVFVVYGFMADAFRHTVIESPRVQGWLRRGFAAAFAGLGLQLALAEK